MRILKTKKKTINNTGASILAGMVAFVLCFLFQFIFVYDWTFFRYPFQEFQIMAMGAKFSGYSWEALSGDVPYGGVLYIPLIKLLFSFGVSGNAVYRSVRWILALINSIPAYITARTAIRYFDVDKKYAFLLSAVAVFASGVRASSVRADVFLVVFIWIFVFALIKYAYSKKLIEKIIHSAVAGISFSMIILTDIEAVVIVPAFVISVLLFRVVFKKWMVNPWGFIAGAASSFLAGMTIVNDIVKSYSAGTEWETSLFKIWGEFFYSIARGAQRLHMTHAVRGFTDIFFSNLWTVIIFSCGISLIGFLAILGALKKRQARIEVLDFIGAFLGISVILSFILLSFTGIKTGIYMHSHDSSPTSTLFGLRYYGFLLAPGFVGEIIILLKKGRAGLNVFIYSLIITVFSGAYVIVSVILPSMNNGYASMKWWFSYEAPFLLLLGSWAEDTTAIWFFIIPTVIVIALLSRYYRSRDYKTAVTLIFLVAVFQFGFVEYFWKSDAEFRDKYDSFIFIVNEGILNTADVSDVYMDGDISDAYALQLSMPKLQVHTGIPEKYTNNIVILSAESTYSVSKRYYLSGGFRTTTLDDNEILVTNDRNIINILNDSQFVYQANDMSTEFVRFLFRSVLGRDPDAGGLAHWSGRLRSGDIEPSELIREFMNSDEFQDRDYEDKELVAIMFNAFTGREMDKISQHNLFNRLSEGETIDEIFEYFVNSDRYATLLKEYNLHDDNADRVNSFVCKVYENCLGRGADETGITFYGNMIRNGEMAPMDLVNTLIASDEYINMNRSTVYTVTSIYILCTGTYPSIDIINSYADQIDSGDLTIEELELRLEGTMAYRDMLRDYNLDEYI